MDLQKLAEDIATERVFGSWELNSLQEVREHFLAIALDTSGQVAGRLRQYGAHQVYAYHDDADGVHSKTGHPIFLRGFRMLTADQCNQLQPLLHVAQREREISLGRV